MKLSIQKELPIRQRVARQDSKSTIVSCLDALVELITNSDDSYRRAEEKKLKKSGIIEVMLKRKRGGLCEEIWVRDYAEGISKEKMKTVYPYGERSSEIEKYSVRGFFGRGLKQSIIAFGEGEIHSFYNGSYSGIKILWDNVKEEALYQEIEELTQLEKKSLGLGESPNETLVVIRNKFSDSDYSIPTYPIFAEQLKNHYALRNIFSIDKRVINIEFRDWNITHSKKRLQFIYPSKHKKILEETKIINKYHDKLNIVLYESEVPFPYEKPTGLSGLIFKSKDANLDLKLFSFENEEAAYYFFGTVDCEGLFEQLKTDSKNLIESNRDGLNWRHPYCKEIKQICEEVLRPHVERKRKELSSDKAAHISRNKKEILNKLRRLLNDIARDELDDLSENYRPSSIENLQIFPDYVYVQPENWRTLSVFAPKYLVDESGTKLKIESNNYLIYSSETEVELIPHPKYEDEGIYFSSFQVTGDKYGEIGKITCTLKDFEVSADIRVKELGHKGPKSKDKKSGGFIKEITPDLTINPSQRGKYESGSIYIYINFPGSDHYINEDLRGITTPEGQLLLAEIVAESFFRSIILKKLEKRSIPIIPGKEIEAFNRGIYELQKKYLGTIQNGVMDFVTGSKG